jgi:hypothetical protein
MAFGWSLVNRLTCPDEQVRGQSIRMGLAAAAALIMVIWIAFADSGAALAGLAVFTFSGALAYAAHARQVASPKRDPGPPAPQFIPTAVPQAQESTREERPETPRVILVSDDEPASYNGPAGWSHRLQRHQVTTARSHGGLLFTLDLDRIRRAYRAMSPSHPYAARIEAFAALLQQRSGSAGVITTALLQGRPHLREALRDINARPQSQVLIIPVNCDAEAIEAVRSAVTQGQLREQGVRIAYAPAISLVADDDLPAEERLQRVLAGQRVPTAPLVALSEAVETAYALVVGMSKRAPGAVGQIAPQAIGAASDSS